MKLSKFNFNKKSEFGLKVAQNFATLLRLMKTNSYLVLRRRLRLDGVSFVTTSCLRFASQSSFARRRRSDLILVLILILVPLNALLLWQLRLASRRVLEADGWRATAVRRRPFQVLSDRLRHAWLSNRLSWSLTRAICKKGFRHTGQVYLKLNEHRKVLLTDVIDWSQLRLRQTSQLVQINLAGQFCK